MVVNEFLQLYDFKALAACLLAEVFKQTASCIFEVPMHGDMPPQSICHNSVDSDMAS